MTVYQYITHTIYILLDQLTIMSHGPLQDIDTWDQCRGGGSGGDSGLLAMC